MPAALIDGWARSVALRPLGRTEQTTVWTLVRPARPPRNRVVTPRWQHASSDSSVTRAFRRRLERLDLGAAVKSLQEARYSLHAAVTDHSTTSLHDVEPTDRDTLLFGGEGYRLGDELVALADRRVTIPTRGNVDSLNVAVASAVVMCHFARHVTS